MRRSWRKEQGFTLMELLVVLLIIGVLSTVAIRTIDATRDRAFFDQTAAEMKRLVQSMVGDPSLVSDGRRTDFGFYGDMQRLPQTLQELIENTTNDYRWHGPYFRNEFTGDSMGHLYDAWGNPYTYDQSTGVVASLGDGKYPMTMKVADTMPHLSDNTVAGHVTDSDNNPPGDVSGVSVQIKGANGTNWFTPPDKGGYFEFSPVNGRPIGIGTYQVTARFGRDSIVRWVNVGPRSKNVLDFRFSRPFHNLLRMVGEPRLSPDSTGFDITIVNEHSQEISVESIYVAHAPDSAYFRKLYINGGIYDEYTIGIGKGDTAALHAGFPIPADLGGFVVFGFQEFYVDSLGPPAPLAKIHGKSFRLQFRPVGSEVSFTVPSSP